MNRRQFVQASGAAAVLAQSAAGMAAPRSLKLLILGGTGFIGPSMLRYAVDRGHSVSIFTRGNRPSPVPEVEHLTGDRNDDLSALEGRDWDVVIDNNARDYRWVERTTELLRDRAERYVFVSSISAYAGETLGYEASDATDTFRLTVDSPLAAPPADFKRGDELPYGATKALGEQVAADAFPNRTLIVRPGFIVGPGDPTDRFTYWVDRIHAGGDVLAPGDGTDPVQYIDVRDLTEWMIRMVEEGTAGAYNGVGPEAETSMAAMLHGMRAITSTPVRLHWVPKDVLRAEGVQPYSDMPIWIPDDPFSTVPTPRSVAAGLTYRPLAVTARDTLDWHLARGQAIDFGISREREAEVLAKWRAA